MDRIHRVEYDHFDIEFNQRCEAVDGLSEVHGLGAETDFLDFGVGAHHELLAPERVRKLNIGDHVRV